MRHHQRTAPLAILLTAAALAAVLPGCGGAPGSPLYYTGGSIFTGPFTGTTPPPTGGSGVSDFFGGGSRGAVDPCAEPTPRKFVRISMANLSDDFIHYFLIMIAFIDTDEQDGAVCVDDIDLYTSFGYTLVPEDQDLPIGNYCVTGPALVYFHENGQFQAGGNQLASAIAPATGSNPTYDSFFTAGGAQVPVPNLILFHNPGTGAGSTLLASFIDQNPCDDTAIELGDPPCLLDAFYYVDQTDRLAAGGAAQLGAGAGRRVANEIQGTGCECGAVDTIFGLGTQNPFQSLAPSGTSATGALCNEFLRGGSITYVFIREDVEPPIPQLLWRVRDGGGSEVHNFDPDAGITGL